MTDLAERRGFDEDVYEPAEDSALLAGVVVEHVGPEDLVLDVGTGSGYVARRVADETGARVVGTDVSPLACRRAREHGIEVVQCDLATAFRSATFDVVAFNPPYLPVNPAARWDDWFDLAVSGGTTGREVIEPFLDDLDRVLVLDGAAFLLVSTYTGVDAVVEYAGAAGFSLAAAGDVSFPGETLTVLRLWR